ncbi:hypothetical protein WJX72_011251 [[Myrmecia] bisecta]|uniref:Apple domain-containing protein n=1 Tax=[Myrmecia] bisecta TaxID=41462 RepID=A0AAW1RAH5_9CHLO
MGMAANSIKAALLLYCLALAASNTIGPVKTLFPTNGVPATVSPTNNTCRHFFRGWDVTGVLDEFDLTVNDGINTPCDCVKSSANTASRHQLGPPPSAANITMAVSSKTALLLCCLALTAVSAFADDDDKFIDNGGDEICKKEIDTVTVVFPTGLPQNVSVSGGSCRHFYRGWDVTGVVNEFDLTVTDGIQHSCDCIKECMKRIGVCMAWVWKFTGDASGQRTCTLYSQFNLPPQVTIAYNTTGSVDANGQSTLGAVDANPHNNEQFGHIQPANLVQAGSTIPRCMTNDGKNPDPDCKSGMVVLFGDDKHTLVC